MKFRRQVASSNGGQTENMGETVEKRPVPGQETARTATETKMELHFISPPDPYSPELVQHESLVCAARSYRAHDTLYINS